LATIKNIPINESLKVSNPKINENFTNINNQVEGHVNSAAAHAAEHITYGGSVVGAENIEQAVDFVDERVSTIIAGGGEGKDPELTDIQTPDPGYTPGREIVVAGDMVRDMQHQFSAQLADIAINVRFPPPPLVAAQPDGSDQTSVIQAIINNCNNVIIPAGDFHIHGTLIMNKDQKGRLHLLEGARLLKPASASNSDPVVWICGYGQELSGANRWSSQITSQRPSPRGVVSLGYADMSDPVARGIYYDAISTLNLSGAGVAETGSANIVLYMANPEVSSKPSYFHNIDSLIIRQANIGMQLEGFANGNIITDIQFIYIGTGKYLEGASIKLKATDGKYPLENSFSNVIQGGLSSGAYFLYFDGKTYGNMFTNAIAEPGGTTGNESVFAHVVGTEHTNNVISGFPNTRGGYGFPTWFYDVNTVQLGPEIYNGLTNSKIVNTRNYVLNNLYSHKNFYIDNLAENTAYEVVRIPKADFGNRVYFVELTVLTSYFGSAIPIFIDVAKATFRIKKPVSGSVSIVLDSLTEEIDTIVIPFESGNDIVFGLKVFNNGSGSSQVTAAIDCKVFGTHNSSIPNSTPQINLITSLTPIASPTVYRRARNAILFSGASANRPATSYIGVGQSYFDTTLNKPIWWNGTNWVDHAGTTV
jgi:hypothetical protein